MVHHVPMPRKAVSKAQVRAPLTALESEVMNAVWEAGSCSVEDVHEVVSRRRTIKEASTRTLLRRLEQKGYLSHRAEGRAYVYSPIESARALAARAVRQIIDRSGRGSLDQLVSGMVDARMLSDEELDLLEKFVENRKAAGA
jgi:BlaI family transcriptional regulator, penicillinase repressor